MVLKIYSFSNKKVLIHITTWADLKDLIKKNCQIKKSFCRSVKDETTGHNGEKLDSHISREDYLTSKKFWNKFNIGRRSINYFKKDVLLLAYVFKKFIDTCLKFYKLDHCHYVSSP